MTSGNQMVDDQDIANNPTPFEEDLAILEEEKSIQDQWVIIYENALEYIESSRLELTPSVYDHMKDMLESKFETAQELQQKKREAIESHLSGSDFEE